MHTRARPALLLGLAGLGFVSLGLPDGLLGVAWPSIRTGFALAQDALGALLVAITAGYVLSSVASGPLLARLGLGLLLALSCLATAASLLGYSLAPAWWWMVLLGVVAGLGAGAIDAGINHYVASHHSARALNLLHAGYGLGTTTGPLLMTTVLMAGAPWQRGYALVAASQLALGLAFAATHRGWPEPERPPAGAVAGRIPLRATLRLPAAWLGAGVFALYTGLEAAAGAWSYTLLTEARGVTMQSAGAAVSLYWGMLMAGRVAFALSLGAASLGVGIAGCMAGLAAGALLLALDLGTRTSLCGLALFGLAAGPIFPSLMSITPRRFAAHAANAVGIQVAAAAVGQALLPAALGLGAAAFGLEVVPVALALGAALLLVLSRPALAAQQDPEPDRHEARAGDPA